MENNNGSEFFTILREVKISKLFSNYQTEYSNFLPELEALKNEIIANDKEIINELKNNSGSKIGETFLLKKLFMKHLSKKDKLMDYFDELMDLILVIIIDNQNATYNKIRKYKMLYFLYGLIIYYRNFGVQTSIITEKDLNFFEKDTIIWSAFAKGPVASTFYNVGDYDKLIFIDLPKLKSNPEEWEVFKSGILTIEKFSTNMLVEESHKTNPWKNNYEKRVKFKQIPIKEIIDYFEKRPPFFVDPNN